MKVYSWKTLLVTILAGGGGIILSVYGIYRGEIWSYGRLAIFVYFVWKGMHASLSGGGSRPCPPVPGPDRDRHVLCPGVAGLSILADQEGKKGNG